MTTAVPLRVAGPSSKPEILIGVDLQRVIDEAVDALSRDVRVYQRSGQLVGVVSAIDVGATRGVKRDAGSPVIREIAYATLRERLASCADWKRYDGRSKRQVPTLPTDPAVAGVMARGEWERVRPLVSVVTSPCLRPDGTVLQTPGYDAVTGTLYRPREQYAQVEDSPTRDDAVGALAAMREVVCDFPFARPECESAWLAGVLTMLARPAIAGPCPLFAVDATTRGTGKSRLVDAAVRLATGSDAARTSLPEDDSEMRKRITSLMLEGDVAVCLDNITHSIQLPSLDAVLTSTVWKDRALGTNTTVSVPARAVWWATGNNLLLGGDLSRRSLHVRLESTLENPEDRTGFRHPELVSWVDSERKRLVACALTLLRAFMISGAAPEIGLWGSFEDWSRVVPAAIVWAGGANPMGSRATQDPVLDEEKRFIAILIDGLRKLCPTTTTTGAHQPLSVRTILNSLYPDRDPHEGPTIPDGFDDMRDAIEQETRALPGRKPEARRLGKWLQRVRGRVVGGWSIQRRDGDHNTAMWRAEPVK